MAHECPECGSYCTCCGDIDDIEFDQNDFCLHYQECEQETDDEYPDDG